LIILGVHLNLSEEAGVEESIVNAPLVSLQSKNTNNAKSEVRFKQLIRDAFTIDSSTPTLRINLNEHPIYSKGPVVSFIGSEKIFFYGKPC
jgi:hypothetical protein